MLFLKLIRDLRKNIISTVTIVFITALGIMFWSGFQGITINLERIVKDYYEAYYMPDIFVTGKDFTYADVRDLLKRDGVAGAAGRTVLDFDVEGGDAQLRAYAQDFPITLNKPLIIEGSEIAGGRSVMADYDYMKANGLAVGDQLKLRLGNDIHIYTITASVKTPENMYLVKDVSDLYPDHEKFGFVLLDSVAVRDLIYGGQDGLYNQLVVKVHDGYLEEIKDYITYKLGSRAASISDRTGHFSASMIEQEITSISSLTGVFPLVFFIIAALIAYTSIKRMVDKERTTIGTLKAVGVKNFAVIAHYAGYGLTYGALASVFGVCLGIVLPLMLFKLFEAYFSLPPYSVALDMKTSLIAAGCSISVCALAAYLAGRKTLKLSPSVCMRPKAGKPGKKILLEKAGLIWKHIGFIRRVAFRNMFRSKDRLVMCVFGITCSAALVFIAFGFQTSIDHMINSAYDKLNPYDVQVFFNGGATDAQKSRVLRIPGVGYGELVMEASAKVEGNSGAEKAASLTVTPDIIYLLGIYDGRNFNEPMPDEGCIVSDFLARDIGVSAGDYITLSFTGMRKTISLKVNRIITQSFGQGVYISRSAWRKCGEGFSATSALLSLQSSDYSGVREKLDDYDFILGSTFQSDAKANMESNMELSKTSVYIMILFSGIISFIVLFNLGILNFYEREREIATLKVVGFQDREIQKMAFGENYIFSAIGILLGCPLGNLGLSVMLDMNANEFFTFEMKVGLLNYLGSAAAILIFSLITNIFLSKYIKRIDIIGALKQQE